MVTFIVLRHVCENFQTAGIVTQARLVDAFFQNCHSSLFIVALRQCGMYVFHSYYVIITKTLRC